MNRFSLVILVFLTSFGLTAQQASGQDAAQPAPLVIGETILIDSRILGETRRINVYTPPGYAEAGEAGLPVLYMPDGGMAEDFLHIAGLVQISALNGTMRPFLLVGIENTERRRDLTGPTDNDADKKIAPRVGGSAAFRAFLRDELIPMVDRTYRTTGEKALVGESLAGLFVVETLLREPDLFDTYIAIDPSLWWNDQHLVDEAIPFLQRHAALEKTLYLATSSQTEIAAITGRLAALLGEGAPDGLVIHHVPMPGEYHHTIYHPAALAAFRLVLAPIPAE